MFSTKATPPPVPAIVREWVQANPMPTLLVTKDLETLAINEAFTTLLTQLDLRVKELLRGVLFEDGSLHPQASGSELFKSLEKGDCAVGHLTVKDKEYYTFHLIKLDLSACASCVCCMLLPNGEPWDGHPAAFVSFEENQRNYLAFVLNSTDGKVSGRGGAAGILKMNPQTLFSKMKKLGLKR